MCTFLVIHDADGTPCFYNEATKKKLYVVPENGIFYLPDITPNEFHSNLHPRTRRKNKNMTKFSSLPRPKKETKVSFIPPNDVQLSPSTGARRLKPTFNFSNISPDEVGSNSKRFDTKRSFLTQSTPNFHQSRQDNASPTKIELSKKRYFMPGEGEHTKMLPIEYTNDPLNYRVISYAKKNFRQQKARTLFNKKEVPIEHLVRYSTEMITGLFHANIDELLEKQALQIYTLLLQYATSNTLHSELLVKIAQKLIKTPALIDETYFYLIKQTTDCPIGKPMYRYWYAFTMIASLFPGSKESCLYIIDHLSGMSRSPIEFASNRAQFVYIRFVARTATHKIKELSKESLEILAEDVTRDNMTKHLFGVSIYEMLWHQSQSHPNILYPYVMHTICDHILAEGAETKTGIFREVGSMRVVKERAEQLYYGNVNVKDMRMLDAGSLLKAWIRELTDPLIPFESVCELPKAVEEGRIIEYANSLPPAHRDTLMYLIGFLQKIAASSEKNLMTPGNLAICLTPNIVQPPSDSSIDPHTLNQIGLKAITELIEHWDTTPIYPCKE